MVEIRFQQAVMETLRYTFHSPRDRVGFIATHHQTADLFLVIRQPIWIAERWQVFWHPLDRVGDHVLVLH